MSESLTSHISHLTSIYDAIATMRALTREGKYFSFSFMSYSHTRQKTDGIVHVRRARLRKRGKEVHNQYAELQEEYVDIETGEPRRFWHCCLMTFNGKKLSIN